MEESVSAVESTWQQQVGALYSEHHGWLQTWLRRKLGNTADAADLVQDTFTRVLASQSPTPIREPRAYLSTITKGILANWCKRQALERAYLDALAAMPEAQAPPPEQRLIILEALHQIDALLDSLPARVRRAFLRSQLDGMTYEAIARELDVSLITVKRYMKQAFIACLVALD